MLLHQNNSLKGTLVKNETGSPLDFSSETAVHRTTAKPVLVLWQSGERADSIAQNQDMISTSIPSTELYSPDHSMNYWSQIDGSDCLNGFTFKVNTIHEDPPQGTLNAAIFDAQFDLEGDEPQWTPVAGSPLTTPPTITGMMNSVLPSERPISPSEFLHKPAPLPHQQTDDDISPETDKLITKLLEKTSEDVEWDSIQLDLDLFNHDEPDMLESLVKESGIKETEEDNGFHCEESVSDILPTVMTQQSVTAPEPAKPKRDSVGPMRVRRERRASKKPVRFRNDHLDEDSSTLTTTELSEKLEETLASTSDTTRTSRRNRSEELSNEEKYLKSRHQNNLASKRCREKRKAKYAQMAEELKTLEERNQVLRDKVARLTALRNDFKKFVKDHLFK